LLQSLPPTTNPHHLRIGLSGQLLSCNVGHLSLLPMQLRLRLIGVPFAVREFVGRGYKAFSNRLAAVAAQPELVFGGKYAPRNRQQYAARTGQYMYIYIHILYIHILYIHIYIYVYIVHGHTLLLLQFRRW
jgi:hypothetical protein